MVSLKQTGNPEQSVSVADLLAAYSYQLWAYLTKCWKQYYHPLFKVFRKVALKNISILWKIHIGNTLWLTGQCGMPINILLDYFALSPEWSKLSSMPYNLILLKCCYAMRRLSMHNSLKRWWEPVMPVMTYTCLSLFLRSTDQNGHNRSLKYSGDSSLIKQLKCRNKGKDFLITTFAFL